MLKTTIVAISLTGTYQAVLPSTIKNYAMIQAKAPAGGIRYKMNGSSAYMEVAENEYFQHPYNIAQSRESCEDAVTVATGGSPATVNFEIQYYEGG